MTRRTVRTTAACSVLALATALSAAPAAAQSFQGTPTPAFGTVTVTESPGTTDIQVDSTSAVLDWTPDDTAISNGTQIVFQPAGTTATFHNNPTAQNDFAILNRIVPVDATRPIVFDGTVVSQLQTAAGVVPGGTVFFYSPAGIIVGANAVFDVGNLGLTTAEPLVDASGNWYVGNQVQFQQAVSSSRIDINPGAQITASTNGSYVAAFAPYIAQYGAINVNGQAALVAGEAGTITFSPDGLFDIQVTIGSDGQSGVGIENAGTITGSASAGAGDNRRIYMVAVPKNSLLQLTFQRGASIGFDIAGAADTVGNAVVLSAGHNVTGGAIESGVAGGGGLATIVVNDSNTGLTGTGIDFTSAVTGEATDSVFIDVFRQTNFASDATFHAANLVQANAGAIPADSVGALNVAGDFTLSTNRFSVAPGATGDAGLTLMFVTDGATASVGGTLSLEATAVFDNDLDGIATGGTAQLSLDTGGALDVGGDLYLDGSSFAASAPASPDAVGGNVQVLLFGASSLDVAGVTRVRSYGIAGDNNGLTGNGSDGTGGFSSVLVAEGSSATFNELNVVSNGVGGVDTGLGAGAGFGGTSQIAADGAGSVLTVQNANVTGVDTLGQLDLIGAIGVGGATGLSGAVAGTGTGGTGFIVASNGGTIALPGSTTGPIVRLFARGFGGDALADGTTGGFGQGGAFSVLLDNGTLTGENLVISSYGGGGMPGAGATGTIDGGDGFGGTRDFTLINGSTFTGSVTGGGPSGVGGDGSATGTGGDGTGGQATLTVDNSTLNVTALGFTSFNQTFGGGGAVGGNASGGSSLAQILNGGVVNIATGATFSVTANSFAYGVLVLPTQTGGDATGGDAQLIVDGGSITGQGTIEVSAVGYGTYDSTVGGNGTGGNAVFDLNNAAISVADILVSADGVGGSYLSTGGPIAGVASGDGTGGQAGINLQNSTITAANTIDVSAEGDAGDIDAAGFTGVTVGTGTGGTAFVQAVAGNNSITATDMRIDGSGSGAPIFSGTGTAGDGIGGQASFRSNASGLVFNGALTVAAEGNGRSAQSGGTGGVGTSGFADVTSVGGGSITVNGTLTVAATSEGGDGTTAGAATFAATGANAVINADNGAITVNGDTFLQADALGGAGLFSGPGGAANAGQVFATAQNGGTVTFNGNANGDAIATGGTSANGDGGAAAGGLVNYLAQSGGQILLTNSGASLSADAGALGGSSNGLGDGGSATSGSALVQADGGTFAIAGNLGIAADATGGNGVNGGDAFGSTDQLTLVNAFLRSQGGGSISVSGTSALTAQLTGGDGSNGGTGGDATGGAVVVLAQTNTASTVASTLVLNDLFAISSADGGMGGASATGTGGAGGNGLAGPIDVLGDAGNGQLTVNGTTTIISSGSGGAGGDGAIGGAGGNGAGGFAEFGTRSGPATSDNSGFGSFADVQVQAVGAGGFGGAGTAGAGGDGGDGTNGAAVVLVRGSQVTISGTADLQAVGLGGNGGTGSTIDGVGGDGIVGGTGGIGVVASNRLNVPANRGNLTANSISGLATASGGTGSTPGASILGNQPALFSFISADGDIGTLNFQVLLGGALTALPTGPDQIVLTDATVNVGDFSLITANNLVLALDGATLNTTNFLIQGNEIVLPAAAPVAPGTVTATGSLQMFASASGGGIETYTDFVTDFGVNFVVDGNFQTGDFTANGDALFQSLGGNVTVGDVAATGGISLVAQNGTVTSGVLSGTSVNVSSGQDVVVGDFSTAGNILLQSLGGSVIAGNLSGANITLNGSTGVVAGDLVSGGIVNVVSGANVAVGAVTAVGDVTFLNIPGTLAIGDVQTTGQFLTGATGAETVGNVVAGGSIDIRGASSIVTGSLTGPASIYAISTGGPLTTGNVSAGDPAIDGRAFGIALRGTSVASGALSTQGPIIALGDTGSIAIGNTTSGSSILLLAAQNVGTGSLTSGNAPGDTVYIGNISDLSRLGPGDDFQPILAVDPARTGGSVNLGGPVTADNVLVAAGGALTVGAVTSTTRTWLSSGGLATIGGAVSGPQVRVISSDIAIPAGGALNASGTLELLSENAAGAFIGDGLGGTGGYRLSSAEFGRLAAGASLLVGGIDTQGGTSMTIGDLAIDATNFGSPALGTAADIVFAVGDIATLLPSGILRVDGTVTATNFTPNDYLTFAAGAFELNATTGGVFVSDSSGALGGILSVEANNIHIASDAILQKLRADPFYAGRAIELNRPGNIDRPDGVFNALGLELYPGQTLYIQNTGSATSPAGFYTTLENSDIEPPGFSDPTAPDVDVIINGRFASTTGGSDITGRDAFDAIVANADSLDGFSDTSQVNGCTFSTSACLTIVDSAPPPTNTSEIEILTNDQTEEEPFDSEEDEDEAEQEARAPIAPPVVLINTSPLNPDVDVTDPVSGTGNPALIGASLSENAQGDQQ